MPMRYALPVLLCLLSAAGLHAAEAGDAVAPASPDAVLTDAPDASTPAVVTPETTDAVAPEAIAPEAVASEAVATAPAAMEAPDSPPSRVTWFWDADPYYSSAGAEIALNDRPVPDGGAMGEFDIYRALFRESLRPRLLMIEASVYPLPVIGTQIKKHQRDFYDGMVFARADGNELNIIDSVTAGFQEPWALSAFIGGEMTFSRAGDEKSKDNHGYMGYLVSGGRKHIRNNILIDDTWWEFEWKLKGDRVFREEKLSWSFRVGLKEHGNDFIRDVAYLGFRRSNLDFNQPLLSLLANSNIDMKTEFGADNGEFLRQEVILGKKVPLKRWRIAPMLEFGVVVEKDDKYSGPLANPAIDEVTLVFRPNIDW